MSSESSTISAWQQPRLYFTIVALYLFALAAFAIWYAFDVFDGEFFSSQFAAGFFAVNVVLIATSAIGAILLLKQGSSGAALLVSFAALVFWMLLGAYLNFGWGCFDCSPTILDYTRPFPFGFPLVSSLAMIGLLYVGRKRSP
jgi:hypothetical protein